MSEDLPNEVQRWTAKRRAALIVSILRGETSAPEAARSHGLTLAEVEDWKEKFLLAGENALRSRPKDEEALWEEQIKKLKQKVGELVLDLDICKEAMKGRPYTRRQGRMGSPGRRHRLPRPGHHRPRIRPPWPSAGGRAPSKMPASFASEPSGPRAKPPRCAATTASSSRAADSEEHAGTTS